MSFLRIDPADPRPIWRQIEEGVRHLVASGGLPASAPVPSVRDLARELQVNPATVAKAYQRLADEGVLAVRRGDGTYVAETPPALAAETRRAWLREGALRYATLAATLGASADEVAGELAAAWQELLRARSPRAGSTARSTAGSAAMTDAARAAAGDPGPPTATAATGPPQAAAPAQSESGPATRRTARRSAIGGPSGGRSGGPSR